LEFVKGAAMLETDPQLVDRAKAGDRAAFERLVERYHQPLLNFLAALLGNSEDARDVAQETFVKAYLSLPSLRSEESFAPWLFRTAHRLGLNWARADRGRSRGRVAEDPSTLALIDTDPAASPQEAFLQAEFQEAVTQAIRRLPPKYSGVVWLRFGEEMKVADIAAALGLTRAATESRLRRGTQMLREELLRVFPELNDKSQDEMQHRSKTRLPGP
jgi:RNA polymerase sigma-70 factor (ECF subfamily)